MYIEYRSKCIGEIFVTKVALMVPALFLNVTDYQIWFKKQDHTEITLLCVQRLETNTYLSCRIYPDVSVDLGEAYVGLTRFGHVQNFYYNS